MGPVVMSFAVRDGFLIVNSEPLHLKSMQYFFENATKIIQDHTWCLEMTLRGSPKMHATLPIPRAY